MLENYFMWKELSEVPHLIRKTVKEFNENGLPELADLNTRSINHIKIIASGSSNNAGHAGRFILEELTNIPVSVEYASEFAHKTFALNEYTLVIGISQSGKTADTLASLKKLNNDPNCKILGITNVKSSPIYKVSDACLLIEAGKELAVPATKTFSLQLMALLKLAIHFARCKNLNIDKAQTISEELLKLPDLLEEIIKKEQQFKALTEKLVSKNHLIILARGINYSLAREGALKFKETCYIDANGYPAGEFMHGYMAMCDERSSILALEHTTDTFLRANILKIRQKSNIPAYALSMNTDKTRHYDEVIHLPATQSKLTSTIVFAACLQMMAFHGSCLLGYNPDKPRSLTKYLQKEI